MNLRSIDLKKLNGITKYPSIPTYHALDPKSGRLTEERVEFTVPIRVTEKVDGTNSRIIVSSGDYIIGSREELLHARGDRIWNPSMGIVDAMRPVAERTEDAFCDPTLASLGAGDDPLVVFYLETFGGNVGGNAKQYTGKKAVSVRLFDVAVFTEGLVDDLTARTPEQIASWRDNGGQRFVCADDLPVCADSLRVDAVPTLASAEALPVSVEETMHWLSAVIDRTRCALDDSAGGAPEGVVVRTVDRSRIAKLRFEDYRRTLKARKV